jgi:hypothetical protein
MDTEIFVAADDRLFPERLVEFALEQGVELDAELIAAEEPPADIATVSALLANLPVRPGARR